MKCFKNRQYDPIKESQVSTPIKIKKSKHALLKNFEQKADHNIEKSKSTFEYKELPAEDVKPGEHRFPCEIHEEKKDIRKKDKKNADSAEKFKKAVENFKQITSDLGIESSIVKSLELIDTESITDDQYNVFEKAINEMDEEGFALFVGMLKSDKSMSSAAGMGGDMIAPQMAGSGKKLVKLKKGIKKSFFVQPNQQ